MLNKVILSGRIAKEFDIRRSGSSAVINFTLCVERVYKTEDKKADYINCVVWNKAAENLYRWCDKGSMIEVVGKLQTREYDKNGHKVYVTEVYVDEIHFLSSKNKRNVEEEHDKEQQYMNEIYNEAQDNFDIQPDDIQF